MQKVSTQKAAAMRVPEARYAYYRRCQVFRRNGVQCKAPAEKGAHICHAHAGQLAMAVRRERARRAMLAEAVAEMRRRDRPECEMADLFTDLKGIQVTLAVMSRAVITGRIDCKTAGQMVVQLQTFSKLLWQIHRKERKDLPLIHTDNTNLTKLPKAKVLTTKDTRSTALSQAQGRSGQASKHEGLPQICIDGRRLSKPKEMMPLLTAVPRNVYRERTPGSEGSRILPFEVSAFGDRCRAHGPPESKAA